ncbi:hypothetical protein JAAARDRAFT_30457 [Jaapia argillacea MUCL 33604]|uniref:Carbohydrate-binding module family 19 domain-containing protein n=1 Tax=Jaapia argillacea MUCL 33604 TaxID=933084 RepID=A0A067Q672_9AGAM|nr:hypothetical protein JAAARDRAFT_30457 [Jaapia argillacea MUCL 33604]
MINCLTLVLALAAVSVNALPLNKRIAQVISASTTKWEAACNKAGGGQQCNTVAVNSFGTLLAAAGPCDQQNAADNMINLAKQLNNDPDMITFAQLFAQQPRNSPNSLSIPYCQTAPANAELNGLFQCQFQSTNPQLFVGNLTPGQTGTIPFGLNAAVNPAGSCPAHTSGPIADGTQLTDITSDPGVGNSGSGNAAPANSSATATIASTPSAIPSAVGAAAASPTSSATAGSCSAPANGGSGAGSTVATTSVQAAVASPSASTSSGDFHLQNGLQAQALNKSFQSLTATSSCQGGTQACVGSSFAQCVGGSFVTTPCSGGLVCLALPLVNKPGTSIACTTESDGASRIAATGAQGGITGA